MICKITKIAALLSALLLSIPAFNSTVYANTISSVDGAETAEFGASTSIERVDTYGAYPVNIDKSKNSQLIPPPFGAYDYNYPADTSNFLTPVLATESHMPIGQNSYASGNNTGNSNYSLTSTVPDWYIDQVTKYTPASSIIDEDGILGTLRIDAVDLNVSVYEGESATILKKGVGHISSTSVWDGNVALAAHNRGASDYFGEIHTLEIGDVIRYSTALGTRKYEVTSVKQIKETDLSGTTPSSDNRITLITCVRDVAELRWQVTAREIT